MGICQPKQDDDIRFQGAALSSDDAGENWQCIDKDRCVSEVGSFVHSFGVCEGLPLIAEVKDPVEIGEAMRSADRRRKKRNAKEFKEVADKHLSWAEKDAILAQHGAADTYALAEDEMADAYAVALSSTSRSTTITSTTWGPKSQKDDSDTEDEESSDDEKFGHSKRAAKTDLKTSDHFKLKLFEVQRQLVEKLDKVEERIYLSDLKMQRLTGYAFLDNMKHHDMLVQMRQDLAKLLAKVEHVISLELDLSKPDLNSELEIIHTAMLEFMVCGAMTPTSVSNSWTAIFGDDHYVAPPQHTLNVSPEADGRTERRGALVPSIQADVQASSGTRLGAGASSKGFEAGAEQESINRKHDRRGGLARRQTTMESLGSSKLKGLSARQKAEVAVYGRVCTDAEEEDKEKLRQKNRRDALQSQDRMLS
eukprot:gnl/MRDRNA2_/MRDRNA2_101605_c0_seq1.p1 gnl/MRDRNA2_/MRDRNA2_101605_c0~~gnl/MRDRNA2_/MRDRNA2_101605_c0_seq1.p1  ORF type:complete len:422 (+),score=96.86 gnl/MRDRNA2_/MRDRNA2_101605_c0_seq1:64-1329(+)